MYIADIIINLPVKKIDKPFSYLIPPQYNFLKIGWRVIVPFGNNKVEGFVVDIKENENIYHLKSITNVCDKQPWFSPVMTKEALWLSNYYLCSLADAMRLFVFGKSGSLKNNEINNKKFISLTTEISDSILELYKSKKAKKSLLITLSTNNSMTVSELKKAGFSSKVINALLADKMIKITEEQLTADKRSSTKSIEKQRNLFQLTKEQQTVCDVIKKSINAHKNDNFLLHGVTGSGKTRIYIELVHKVRLQNRQAVILVPEISLTEQTVYFFSKYFKDDIIVFHSQLSKSEKNNAISRIKNQSAGIVIGARSALFLPYSDIGIIIIDEEQDSSYKQEEKPFYHAKTVASAFAKIHNAILLLGSATPSIESYYSTQNENLKLLKLPNRIHNNLPDVEIVDMRQELKNGNNHIISAALKKLILSTVLKNEQVVIMLNRRGYSTFVMCRSCGYVITCPSCNMPMVYHMNGNFTCHHCNLTTSVPDVCPKCNSPYIKYFGSGTEKFEKELKNLVPNARIIRMDYDTTRKKGDYNKILSSFKKNEYDILLGTQMVAKGHDVSNVTAVGIISADSTLNVPDFRAAERCFMLITQTAGRAGRNSVPGRVVVQTYNAEHYAIVTGQSQDYESFYHKEIAFRKELFFPPFCQLIKITAQHTDEHSTEEILNNIKRLFEEKITSDAGMCMGPYPALIYKINDNYRFCLLIKTTNLSLIQNFLRDYNIYLLPKIIIDINPISIN